MDPCRIRSYLQVACAGLGFEIGEIWWTANEHGSSTVAAIEERPSQNGGYNGAVVEAGNTQKLRFVQLYTSKSYANRRSMLVTPPEDSSSEDEVDGYDAMQAHHHHQHHHHHHDHECTTKDLEKHKLSPRLVDAISKTAQVVWANTLKQEGLTGRSDIPLHTAVGMPVALDADGNMCVVVMFSPNNIQSTDEAMEYLQSISRSATSSSIPCLMPAFDKTEHIQHVPTSGLTRSKAIRGHIMPQEASLGEGVTARFVSIDEDKSGSSTPEQRGHDLASAPKDCFGIPMLPSFAELGNDPAPAQPVVNHARASPAFEDVFDEASYGVWSTIMQERPVMMPSPTHSATEEDPVDIVDVTVENGIPVGLNEGVNPAEDNLYDPKSLVTTNKRTMERKRKERLEEFCSAFLGMSVFDIADVWIPAGPEHPDCLSHVVSISSSNQSNAITDFKRVSGYTLIKFWSGAVGRAYASGNPVWSCNPDVYIDKGRSRVFERANIMTAFAVPIISGKKAIPIGVVSCYSMIQAGSVPFVLRFVQQALHLLWSGLDKVEPHESVGQQMWRDVGPADLGEMAADVEMQHHFIRKKRPHNSISGPEQHEQRQQAPQQSAYVPDQSAPLTAHFRNINFHRDEPAPSFSMVTPTEEEKEPIPEFYNFQQLQHQHSKPPEQRVSVQAIQAFQNHIKEAVRQVGEALPFTHAHIATTSDGSKRAHVAHHQPTVQATKPRQQPAPLAMPHALPTHVVKATHPHHGQSNKQGAPTLQSISPQLMSSTPSQITNNLPGRYSAPCSAPPSPAAPSPTFVAPPSQAAPPPTYVAPPSPAVPPPIYVAPSSPAAPPPIYVAPPSPAAPPPTLQPIAAPPSPATFTQHAAQSLQVQQNATQAPAPAPSQLSQNLLSPGMLESIANQQYQYQCEPAPNTVPTQQNAVPQYAPPPLAPAVTVTSTTAPSTSAIPVQQPPLQTNGGYCMPTSSGGFPAPDPTKSGQTIATSKVKLCRIQGCDEAAVVRRPYCARHSGNRLCEHEGCTKCAQGSTRFCIAHGGGRRCTFPGCDKGARDKFFCAAHGGGKRCKAEGCNKSAVGGSSLCTAHGGGRRCAIEGCDKSAQSSTKFCVKHGGGKKCSHEGCEKVARGRTQFCAAHGGGIRCKLEGCNRVAIGKMQLCRAHGGGSRAKKNNSPNIRPPPLPPIPVPAPAPTYIPNTAVGMHGISMEYPTATSV